MSEGGFHRDRLESGITILAEEVPGVRSAALGVWIGSGSRNEEPEQCGLSHFIEHMVFKGTETRSAFDIARSLEAVGGHLDAFSSKEYTCYYGRVLDEHLPLAVDVLSDIVCHSVFADKDIEREKKVVLDEIRALEDTPDDEIHDLFASVVWKGHSLGRSILGTRETVGAFTRDDVARYFRENYVAPSVIVSVAGSFDYQALLDLVARSFKLPAGPAPSQDSPVPAYARSVEVTERRLSQEYFCVGTRGVSYNHELRHALLVMNVAMGGGASSRLFQRVREEEGLAYSVFTYADFLRDSGIFGASAGVDPGSTRRALDVVLEEFEKAVESGLSEAEVLGAKEQLKGSLVLGLESMSNRMTRLARSEIYYGRYVPVDELVARIDAVSVQNAGRAAELMLDRRHLSVVALGPASRAEIEGSL
ncbi:MAG: insulinase family protein [Candidatus Eisenbacteria bacterium]|nr:insulinase family protein [Candidatus Eisenbacteria bacterium]